jgi:hypothetical protein
VGQRIDQDYRLTRAEVQVPSFNGIMHNILYDGQKFSSAESRERVCNSCECQVACSESLSDLV